MDRCLRLVLALALAFGGFFAPAAVAHGRHHHAAHAHAGDARSCCDGGGCDCGCKMHAGAPVAIDVSIARLPPDLVAARALIESPAAPREPALRPPIR